MQSIWPQIEHPQHCARTAEVLDRVGRTFPNLESKIAWSQSTFTGHGTFIIGFSVSAKHLDVSPEQAGYAQDKTLFRILWGVDVNYPLLHRIIDFNRGEKADCKTFWREGP